MTAKDRAARVMRTFSGDVGALTIGISLEIQEAIEEEREKMLKNLRHNINLCLNVIDLTANTDDDLQPI